MELAGLGKMVPRVLRKFKGGTVADSSGWPFALIFYSTNPRQAGNISKKGKGRSLREI